MDSKNTVASILKVYGIINGIACIILGLVTRDNLPYTLEYLATVEIAAGIVVSFLIYALGEVIQLLHDLKINTSSSKKEAVQPDELPEI